MLYCGASAYFLLDERFGKEVQKKVTEKNKKK